jgi:DNA-binding protein
VTNEAGDGRAPGDETPREAPNDSARSASTPSDSTSGAPTSSASAPGVTAPRAHPKDPLHGITLQTVLEELHARYGWAELGRRIPIRCFTHDPSMGSSLAFLRRQSWARSQVEELFLRSKRKGG